ncbi:MAG: CDP-alcohol phosphatidyltransferase family protein [Pseudonocardia sp.]|uniref:CDP-alcohol phosphatidyltransferase family protein n=1 Tax=unclassified Pseudonocardia TaxID=2619320 RepID=UPI00086A6B1B|nr:MULTISPECIES: CDP-alcohol phosphatidyltransferase family protein [unclassified Pseudonocardia]MBN9109324.1 CDP-alcohol phosphatidyltransferase family protein [Pseudonocardia sp.]ODU25697.1 MAG: CDP-alcohol phosphatidyltransferase [Pseudonocardia sp. SCN 72-51]ODV08038.1 MAG: CDP-alcohol phosphatidyltransferase [Pseudonocardia sp. SCN 73-27]
MIATTVLGELALLGVLAATTGLGVAGWVVGIVHALVLAVLIARGRREDGPADRVTAVRAVLGGGVTALVADGVAGHPVPVVALVVLASVALALDAVDGRVARRTRTASVFGARFDMEADAWLIAMLSVHVAGLLGWWVLAIGSMRYVFVLVTALVPWLRGTVPPTRGAKVVAAAQGIVLVVASARLLPATVDAAIVGIALVALVWSFGRDVRYLNRARSAAARRRRSGASRPVASACPDPAGTRRR